MFSGCHKYNADYQQQRKKTTNTATPTIAKTIFETIARFVRNAIRFVFKTVSFTVRAAILLAIVLPIIFFAWRSAQPMDAPQFNGLTFYQYLDWRFQTHNAIAAQYQATHPDATVKVAACYIADLGLAIFAPITEVDTLAGKFPILRQIISPRDYPRIPSKVSWTTLPSTWWTTYETAISFTISDDTYATPTYCRLPHYPPTPEQLALQKP